jgi:alpha-mannosidase
MLKHPALTRDRIFQFMNRELLDRIITETHPLECEFLTGDFANDEEAMKQEGWQKIEPGFCWGPAYTVGWYRVTGSIPKEWAGKAVSLGYGEKEIRWEKWNSVEGTVWSKGQTLGGLDFGHSQLRLTEKAAGGEAICLSVQTYAHNKETTVSAPEKPRSPLPEEYKGFHLWAMDLDLWDLYCDFDYAYSLMTALPETSPLYHQVMRLLNEAVNSIQGMGKKGLSAGRKALKDGLTGLASGGAEHEITAVGHAHLDTAWLWPLRVTELKMIHTTSVQLELISRCPEYVFVHSQASQYEWLAQQHPQLLDRIRQAMKKGQWEAVGSMWVEADCNLTGSEALVRQFLYGRRWFKQNLGVTTEDMWLPDVFGYSAAIPQILSKFGIQYFLTQKLSWNDTNKPPHQTFWWEGIDGSKVWVHFPPADTYNATAEPKEILGSLEKYKDHGRCDSSLLLFGFGDGGGGPTDLHVERLRRARRYGAGLPTIHGKRKAVEFFRDAKAKSKDLMTWKGELYFEKHRGTYTTQANNKKHNRYCEHLMRDAEWLQSFAGPRAQYPAAEIERAWKLVLLNQFHDIIPGSSVREVYEDSERQYKDIRESGARLVTDALVKLAEPLAKPERHPVALFHNSTVPSEASVPWPHAETPSSIEVGGEAKAVQLVEAFGERKLIFATPDAALGGVAVAGFSDQPATALRLKAAARRLENSQFIVKFDGSGHIVSVQSQDDEPAEFIAPGLAGNVFQIFEDTPLFWDAWDVDAFSLEAPVEILKCESFEVVEKGPVRAAVEIVKKFGRSTIRQRISLGPTPGIRFDTEIDWQEDHRMLKVAFPVNIHAPRASYEIQWGHVERPTHRNTSWDMARFEVCCHRWMDLSEGGQGVTLMNDGKYGCDIVDNVMRLTLLRAPKAPDPIADRGVHRFTYVFYPHFDQIQHSDTVAAAYALNSPCRWAWLEPGEGSESATPLLASTDTRSVVIESVKKAEDSELLVVRAYECHATRGRTEIKLASPIKRAWLADLNEEPLQELAVDQGRVAVAYKPFEIITILAEV